MLRPHHVIASWSLWLLACAAGDVAVGLRADLVVLTADPLRDVANFAKIHRVVHGGRLYDPDALIESIRR